MKRWSGGKKGFLAVACLIAVFLLSGAQDVCAQMPVGDLCWTVTVTQKETGRLVKPEKFLVKMHFVRQDASQATVHGVVNVPDNNPFILMGTAARIGSWIYINLTTTQSHKNEPWRDGGIMQVRLNPTTLFGTFYEVLHDFNTTTLQFDPGYSSGTLTRIICP